MEPVTFSLCTDCEHCPEVVNEECVRIGEAENIVRLSHAEWNRLVALVRSEQFSTVVQTRGRTLLSCAARP